MTRVYPCSFSNKLVYEIIYDAPSRGYHFYKETRIPQKDYILYCKKEAFDIDKHDLGIHKEDRLVGQGFITADPMDCVYPYHGQGKIFLRK